MRMLYRIPEIGYQNLFHTYERALRRARDLRTRLKQTFTIVEVDREGNETPIALVAPKRAPVETR